MGHGHFAVCGGVKHSTGFDTRPQTGVSERTHFPAPPFQFEPADAGRRFGFETSRHRVVILHDKRAYAPGMKHKRFCVPAVPIF